MNKQGRLVVLCFVTGVLTYVCINEPAIEEGSVPLAKVVKTESDLVVNHPTSSAPKELEAFETKQLIAERTNLSEEPVKSDTEQIAGAQIASEGASDQIVAEESFDGLSLKASNMAPDR